jgi:glycosyltransferase involved in cell wall biosynthesis
MKVLQVCQRYFPYIGGLETHVRKISEGLVRQGFEVDVLTTDPSRRLPQEELINGIRIRRFKGWAPNEAYYFSEGLRRHLFRVSRDYDLVHAHGYHAFPALYAALAKRSNLFIFTPHYHGKGHTFFRNLLLVPYKLVGAKAFQKADKVICVSNYERHQIINDFDVDSSKFVTIPNGLDLQEFEALKKQTKNSRRVILCVARLEKYKGIDFLIRALPKLESDIVLQIVGKGPYNGKLITLGEQLGVSNRIKFFRDLSRHVLLQKYVDADLFVLLSKYEAYGISVGEALMSGTPCIVAKTSALQEWVDDFNCFGIEYPPEQEALIRLVNKVIGKRVDKVKILDWIEVVKRLIRVYEGLP